MDEIDVVVSGKVQGVGFREFVRKHASALWLAGYVENRGLGELHVVAQGPEEKLKKLLGHLRKGPFLSRVRDVAVVWQKPKEQLKEFLIV